MINDQQLPLSRCPHCSVAHPTIARLWTTASTAFGGKNPRIWCVYCCTSCGGMVLTSASQNANAQIDQILPQPVLVSEALPARAREYLTQAVASLHAPAGAIMLTASAVDSMLKDKGIKDGSLNSRIDAAAKSHLITEEMALWAHEIRLDANEQRHADDNVALPSEDDAKKVIDFANALAQFLYVLPARVERGRKA